MYEDYMAEMPMMSAHVDTLLIIRAKDDKVERGSAFFRKAFLRSALCALCALRALLDAALSGT